MKTERINGHPIKCYSLGESVEDRYTVVYMNEPVQHANQRLRACYGESGHGSAIAGRHLGKRIPFLQLPPHLQLEVRRDLDWKHVGFTELVGPIK